MMNILRSYPEYNPASKFWILTFNPRLYQNGARVALPFHGSDISGDLSLHVSWGDGTTSILNSSSDYTDAIHTYSNLSSGTVDVVVTSDGNGSIILNDNDYRPDYENATIFKNTVIKSVGTAPSFSDNGIEDLFYGCEHLIRIEGNLLANSPNVSSCKYMLRDCTNLEYVPTNLFFFCPNISTIFSVCSECTNLAALPSFRNCKNISKESNSFQACTSIEAIPENMFANSTVDELIYTFYKCTNLKTIPGTIFKNCSNLTTLDSLFYVCSSLVEIPSDLFNDVHNITDITQLFRATAIERIPDSFAGKFTSSYCLSAFSECKNLTYIPSRFLGDGTLYNYVSMFSNCAALESIPEDLFAGSNTNNTYNSADMRSMFFGTAIKEIPENLFKNIETSYSTLLYVDKMFQGCTNLVTIPEHLFSIAAKYISFTSLFEDCTALRVLPQDLFCYNSDNNYSSQSIDIGNTFANCPNIYTSNNVLDIPFGTISDGMADGFLFGKTMPTSGRITIRLVKDSYTERELREFYATAINNGVLVIEYL